MPKKTDDHRLDLPLLELKCMQALWGLGEARVHEIRSRLRPERTLAYTTVMTIMDRLARKGAAGRVKRGKAYVYRPLVSEEAIVRQAVARLLTEYFRGSRQRLLQFLGERGSARTQPSRNPPASLAPPAAATPRGGAIDASLL